MICVVIIAMSGRDKTVVTETDEQVIFCFKKSVKYNDDC